MTAPVRVSDLWDDPPGTTRTERVSDLWDTTPSSPDTGEAPSAIDGTGYGILADLGHKIGVGARSAIRGVGDLAGTMSGGLGPGMGQLTRPLIDRYASVLASPFPEAETTTERVMGAGIRGGVSTGGLGGLTGVASGVTGGMASEGAAELGAGPLAQMGAGIVGGMGPGVIRRAVLRGNPATRASTIVSRATEANDAAGIPDVPEGRVRQYLALRVAGQGGAPADRLGTSAAKTVQQYQDDTQRIADATRQRAQTVQQQGRATARAGSDAMAATRMQARDEVARLRDVERQTVQARRAQADQMVTTALQGSTGDRVADAIERAAQLPKATGKQMLTQAEAQLRVTGKEVFGALEDMEFPPSEATAPLYEAMGEPNLGGLIREAYEVYAPKIEHTPRFQELQKAYQLLGARARQAARNGGALPNGTLMGDLYAARDALGDALESTSGQFRSANAAYRARASVVDGLHRGVADAIKGKAPDMEDAIRALQERGGEEAAAAYRLGVARGTVDRLREVPTTRDAAARVAAGGSDEVARLRVAFPDDAAYEQFVRDLSQSTGMVAGARAAGEAGVAAVGPEFIQRRAAVRTESLEQVRRMAKDVRAAQDATRRGVQTIQQEGREQQRAIPREPARDAQQIVRASKRLDVPERGRPLKGAVEIGVGARARGLVDLIYGTLGKKADPADVRALLADYLLSEPDGSRALAAALREAQSNRRTTLPISALLGAQASGGAP